MIWAQILRGVGPGASAARARDWAAAAAPEVGAGAPPEARLRRLPFVRRASRSAETRRRDERRPREMRTSRSAARRTRRAETKSSRPESRESAGSGGSRASSGKTSGVSDVSVLPFRDRDSGTAYAVRERLVKAPKTLSGRKPPVSASGVHGSGSRLRAMQREAARERSARTADAGTNRGNRGFDPRGIDCTYARDASIAFDGEAPRGICAGQRAPLPALAGEAEAASGHPGGVRHRQAGNVTATRTKTLSVVRDSFYSRVDVE